MKAIKIAIVVLAATITPVTMASANSGLHHLDANGAGCQNPGWINIAFGRTGATVPCMMEDRT